MSVTVLHPDQFANEQYSEPGTRHIVALVRFASLDQPVGILNPHDGGRLQAQRLGSDTEPVWERGEHKLIGEMPQSKAGTGRPLTHRPGQIDVRWSQLEVPR
jgi:hypothetical protein